MRLDFDQIFDDYIAANQKVWSHDRSLTVGASEAFDCIRKTWFVKRGAEFGFVENEGEERWGAMERGNLIEEHFVVPAVLGHLPAPAELLGAGDDQETIILGRSSAHLTDLSPNWIVMPLRITGLRILKATKFCSRSNQLTRARTSRMRRRFTTDKCRYSLASSGKRRISSRSTR